METFVAAAREWNVLLGEVGEDFVSRHLDNAMQLAIALHYQKDQEAEHATCDVSSAELQDFVALSMILQRLLEAATRDHMTFLLPDMISSTTKQASLLKEELSIMQSLPDAFRQRFRQLLAMHWDTLVESTTLFPLPGIQDINWSVAKDNNNGQRIHLRVQTSDGRTRKIHVPIQQFHELRYSVASILHEMNMIEAHPIMQLNHMKFSR
ncbi:uncharacterized protein PHALS_11369 [Plasmopara halstedii]|uniref:COMM domain-containing protein n=1 Tax=Plasmopara halstedii TaxID=4781 RepID=A0A0P1A5P7_PLAHL|nr:uncharacterized protein PHALS_11369 [Plasmopara halstedii]CEG35490.1 hypothetical protein PHALS_11369 [Plasmopara halstedii]|eukprot:XP_024571859.1 hypothetical protein PHALS_11369 [Plasmopara halstedii]